MHTYNDTPGPQAVAAPPAKNGLAIAALIVAIVGLCIPVIGPLVAIVLGIVALVGSSGKAHAGGAKAMSIIAICLGVLCLALTPMILAQAMSRARDVAIRTKSGTQMQEIHRALEIYAQNNHDEYPDPATWTDDLVNAGLLDRDTLEAPLSDGSFDSYFFVPNFVTADHAGARIEVRLYEHPDLYEDGGNILTPYGDVKFYPEPAFSSIIYSLTNPDGTPYQPHED